MDFALSSTDPTVLLVQTIARWNVDGAGKTVSTVVKGTYADAGVTECWDSAFTVSYYAESWPGGQTSGLPTGCPQLTGP